MTNTVSLDSLSGPGDARSRLLESTIAFGKINLSNASMSVAAWRISAPFKRDSAVNTGKKQVGTQIWTDCTSHPNIGGRFGSDRVRHPVGTILAFQTTRTRNKVRISDGTIFLRLREGAAFIALQVKLPTGPESLLGDRFIVFQGYADVLSLEELKVCGIEIARNYQSAYMDPEEVEENLEVVTVTPESVPRPELRTVVSGGKVKAIAIAQEPVRRIGRLRRAY